MGKGIEIGIASETKAFKQGVEAGIIDPIEDAVKALDELGDADGPEKLERALEDAQRETKDLGRVVERTARDIEDEFKRSYKRVGQSADDGYSKVREAGSEFKDEAISNFSEVTSSFRGDMESVADLAQGTFGGIASGLAGISLPAAIAAGGVGAVLGATFEGVSQQSETMKETVSTNFQEMADNGIAAWQSVQSESQRLTDAYGEHEDEIKRIADLVGLPFETVASAWAGNKDAIDTVNSAYAEMKEELRSTSGVGVEAANATIAGWDGVMGSLNGTLEAYDKARDKAERLADQQSNMWLDAIAGADEVMQEVDELGNRLITLADGTQILIEADTKKATQNLDKFKGDLDGVPERVKTTAILELNTYDFDSRIWAYKNMHITVRADIVDQYGRVVG